MVPLQLSESFVLDGVGLDEQAGPVPLRLEEHRVGGLEAVSRAALHVEAVVLASEDLVQDPGLVVLAVHDRSLRPTCCF